VRDRFGEEAEKRLRLDGQLTYLTLSNVPLIRKLHADLGKSHITDMLSLVEGGYYRAGKWQVDDVPIPPEITGEKLSDKRAHYRELLAAQVRLSFLTAVVAQMVNSGETELFDEKGQPVPDQVLHGVTATF